MDATEHTKMCKPAGIIADVAECKWIKFNEDKIKSQVTKLLDPFSIIKKKCYSNFFEH